MRVQSLPESRSQTLAGEFTVNNAGGNHLSADWAKNPKYHMTLLADRPCKVRLPLLLPARAVAGNHLLSVAGIAKQNTLLTDQTTSSSFLFLAHAL